LLVNPVHANDIPIVLVGALNTEIMGSKLEN